MLQVICNVVMGVLIAVGLGVAFQDWMKAKDDPSLSTLDKALKGHDDPSEPARWVP
ncbi:MAG: hypothetical protein H0X25_20290 [Acidobacteriales bacterium]|nr:hypothetical protein [Terriglobales bacterium]